MRKTSNKESNGSHLGYQNELSGSKTGCVRNRNMI